MHRPYIGITDFRTQEQVKDMLSILRESYLPFWTPRLGVGVMMSHKTLNGLPTKWTDAFPKNEEIAGIWVDDKDVYNVLHFADYDGNPLVTNLLTAMDLAGDVDAIQLDMVWPNPHDVSEFRDKFCDVEIILQLNQQAIARAGSEDRIIDMLCAYQNSIDVVLLDLSGGTGRPLNSTELGTLDHLIYEHMPRVQLAVAGGLGPDTLELADPFFQDNPQLSIDAQSKLRASGSALDPINWDRAERYLLGAATRYQAIIAAIR
jgi:hypothetical protein